jgi:hypothetical protein
MPDGLSTFTLAARVTMALAVVLVILLAIFGYRVYLRSRVTPEERERRRRAWLVATGKMGDAMLVEVRDTLVFYCYDVGGVEYTASQDIAPLAGKVPGGLGVGAVCVKYDPRNPANSIVVAEEWTGLR